MIIVYGLLAGAVVFLLLGIFAICQNISQTLNRILVANERVAIVVETTEKRNLQNRGY